MKFTNDTWFHMVVLVSIAFVGGFMGEFIAEKVFGIKEGYLVSLITGMLIGPPVGFYFVKRVKKK